MFRQAVILVLSMTPMVAAAQSMSNMPSIPYPGSPAPPSRDSASLSVTRDLGGHAFLPPNRYDPNTQQCLLERATHRRVCHTYAQWQVVAANIEAQKKALAAPQQ